jgi:hypothetical protein
MTGFAKRCAGALALGLAVALCAMAAELPDSAIQPGDSRQRVIAVATQRVPGEVVEIAWNARGRVYQVNLIDEQGLERQIYVHDGFAYLRSDAEFDPRWEQPE